MKASTIATVVAVTALSIVSVSGETIAAINGNKFLSPLKGKTVTNVRGLITGKTSTGIFMRSTAPDNDPATSESIFVFSKTLGNIKKGDIITLGGTVAEYRADKAYLYLTELTSPTNVVIASSGNTVTPVVLGTTTTGLIGNKNLNPPTDQYTSLDNGTIFATPNNQTQVSVQNPTLRPGQYGMDFWESLSGEYVTVRGPTVLDQPNQFGDTWVVGDWPVTGRNARGGLTVTSGDGNPEAILIQTPLDNTDNPKNFRLGDTLQDISGVITYAFGQYTIRPDTFIKVKSSKSPALPPATTLVGTNNCKSLTFSDYNVENLTPDDENANKLANQIVNALKSPTILFLQEVQDNSGPTNDGVTSANRTLENLTAKIVAAGGPQYSFASVDPLDGTTGGEPGGNIRNAYLYQAKVVKLFSPRPGGPTEPTSLTGVGERVALTRNPGLIAPNSPAFNGTRRPLVAQWSSLGGRNKFFTVNTHQTSKGGSSTLFGDYRPPINEGVDERDQQARVTGAAIQAILNRNNNARIIAAGDFNEFRFVKPQDDFVSASGLRDVDEVTNLAPAERYGYLFDQNSQSLIHLYVSPMIADRQLKLERIHINTWVSFGAQASDHDPQVILANTCQPA